MAEVVAMIDPTVVFVMLAFAAGLYVGLTVQDGRDSQ
jgi:hypothetical protein